jgi:hypothetical protein
MTDRRFLFSGPLVGTRESDLSNFSWIVESMAGDLPCQKMEQQSR